MEIMSRRQFKNCLSTSRVNFSLSYAVGIGLPDNNFGDEELMTIADGDDLENVFKVTSFDQFLAQIDDIVAALQTVTFKTLI